MEQRSPEWFQARLGKATASRFADIMATTKSGPSATRKNYLSELVLERLTHKPTESYTNQAMINGIETEPLAKLRYELATGLNVIDTGFWEHKSLLAGASPDGLIGDNGLLEIKCPIPSTHIQTLKTRKTPPKYIAQIQGQMWITKRDWCDFVSFNSDMPVNAQLFIVRVLRDEGYIKNLEKEVRVFLDEVKEQVGFIECWENKVGETDETL